MNKDDFSQLIESIKEAGDIKSGKNEPSRTFNYQTPNVKPIRKKEYTMERFDALAAEWDNNPQRVERAKIAAEFIKKHVPFTPGMTAFEYGCGTGLLSFNLQTWFTKIVLGDSSQGMLDVLEKKIRAAGITTMIPENIDLSNDIIDQHSFDAIYTQLTLHHIVHYQPIIDKFIAMLRPFGYLSIIDLDKEDGSFHDDDFDGHNGFDTHELASTIVKKGMSIIANETCFHIVKDNHRSYPVFIITAQKKSV